MPRSNRTADRRKEKERKKAAWIILKDELWLCPPKRTRIAWLWLDRSRRLADANLFILANLSTCIRLVDNVAMLVYLFYCKHPSFAIGHRLLLSSHPFLPFSSSLHPKIFLLVDHFSAWTWHCLHSRRKAICSTSRVTSCRKSCGGPTDRPLVVCLLAPWPFNRNTSELDR